MKRILHFSYPLSNYITTLIFVLFAALFFDFSVDKNSLEYASKWKDYKSKEGKVSIQFPAEYTESDASEEERISKTVTCTMKDKTYMLNFTVHSTKIQNVKEALALSLATFSKELKADVKSEGEFNVKKNKGIDCVMYLPEFGMYGFYRVLVVEKYHYQILILSANEKKDADDDKFFKSFKLMK